MPCFSYQFSKHPTTIPPLLSSFVSPLFKVRNWPLVADASLSWVLGNLSNPQTNKPICMKAFTPGVPSRDEGNSLQTAILEELTFCLCD